MKIKEAIKHLHEQGIELYTTPNLIVISNYLYFEGNIKQQFDRVFIGTYQESRNTFTKSEDYFYSAPTNPFTEQTTEQKFRVIKSNNLIKSMVIYQLYIRANDSFYENLSTRKKKNKQNKAYIYKKAAMYTILAIIAKALSNKFDIKNIEKNIYHHWIGYKLQEKNTNITVIPTKDNVYVHNTFVVRIVRHITKKEFL